MKKLLYVDLPFQGYQGGDKNRSKFIWHTLCENYDADLLLVKTPEFLETPIPEHSGYDQLFSIGTMETNPFMPSAVYSFSYAQKQQFKEILLRKRYELIVFRFLSVFPLARIASKCLPESKIIVDVDMLFSRISELSWHTNKSLSNRFHLQELIKLRAFEFYAFRHEFKFFFTNPYERDIAVRRYHIHSDNALIFPNMMPNEVGTDFPDPEHKYILYFGTLNSAANQDGFAYLAADIYPRIAKKMQEKDVYLYIAGKNPTSIYKKYSGGRIKILGAVDNMQALIANALFVVLPLRVASGTRTRILEAAIVKKAIVTTSIGAEGFDFSAEELICADSTDGFAKAVIELLQFPAKADNLGNAIYDKAMALYSPQVVADAFIAQLETEKPIPIKTAKNKRLKIALVTNRFWPEVGGAETNIYYQARKLALHHDVNVLCPMRIKKPKYEEVDGFGIHRFWDVYNIPPRYPNLEAKTLCPELFFHLLFGDYDIIQCFPALNYNNYLAYLAAKLRGKPIIMCFFDFIDYAAVIKEHGSIDPNILKEHKLSTHQRFVLEGLDYVFAIADKEIEYIRRYNPRIEYSPVPILSEEYERPVANPRESLGIKSTDFVFLCLGRVSHIKGQDIALHAFAKAHAQIPDAKLVFVGRTDYEQDFFDDMLSYVSQNMLQNKVFFTGMVDRNQVLGWLRHSEIHVIPVRFMNSGAVVVESWISDTPVLQSDVVDPNLVNEEYNGYLFPSEDIGALAQKMIVAYNKRNKLAQMAENGKALVKSKYTYEYLIELYNNTYTKLTSL